MKMELIYTHLNTEKIFHPYTNGCFWKTTTVMEKMTSTPTLQEEWQFIKIPQPQA